MTLYRLWGKRLVDVVLALCLLPLALMLGSVIALVIAIDSGFPVLFCQKRVGRGGACFTILKFRTMVPGSERLGHQATEDDPRITRVGFLLRKTGLDEIPQILNILKGDMSFVGPRPWTPDEITLLGLWHSERFLVRPGMVSVAAVIARHQLTYYQKDHLDCQYVKSVSMLGDVCLLVRAVFNQFIAGGTTAGEVRDVKQKGRSVGL